MTSERIMVFSYGLVTLFWLWVLIRIDVVLPKALLRGSRHRQILRLGQGVALILTLDSAYWLAVNGAYAGLLPFSWYAPLKYPWFITILEFGVLLSGVLFFLILKRSSRVLEQEQQDIVYRQVIDQTWDAIGILDERGTVKFWNKGAERLFGFAREDVRGRDVREFLVPSELKSQSDELLNRVSSSRAPETNYGAKRLTATGSPIFVDITVSPIIQNGDVTGFFGIMRETAGGSGSSTAIPARGAAP